ncbi:MAG: hypothetical protein ACOCYR_01990 [Erythrobacter sp.]
MAAPAKQSRPIAQGRIASAGVHARVSEADVPVLIRHTRLDPREVGAGRNRTNDG